MRFSSWSRREDWVSVSFLCWEILASRSFWRSEDCAEKEERRDEVVEEREASEETALCSADMCERRE